MRNRQVADRRETDKSGTVFACVKNTPKSIDVLRFARENSLSEKSTIDIYYPYLSSDHTSFEASDEDHLLELWAY